MTTNTDPMPLADRITSRLDMYVREHIWSQTEVDLRDLGPFEVVCDDEISQGDDEMILRGPDGKLYDVEIMITVSERD